MTREAYSDRLTTLRRDVREMGEIAVERFEQAVEALTTRDRALAREVIDGDEELNELYLELEGDCVELVALQQPVAGDLRLIASSFKILTDLERVGDLATNLAEYALEREHDRPALVDVEPLADEAAAMLDGALDAYADDDAAACRRIAERDDELDELCREASTAVVRNVVARDPATTSGAEIEALLADVSTALLTVRDVERVGDHAVNVAARTLYQVENDDELLY